VAAPTPVAAPAPVAVPVPVPVPVDPTPAAAPEPPSPTPPPPPVVATPVFARDDVATTSGGPARIAVLDNDGADGLTLDPASFAIIDPPAHDHGNPGGAKGTVTSDGVVLYLPAPRFTGVDGFTYRICTTTGECQTARVTILVS
jgi:hypothetical protein